MMDKQFIFLDEGTILNINHIIFIKKIIHNYNGEFKSHLKIKMIDSTVVEISTQSEQKKVLWNLKRFAIALEEEEN